MRVLGVGVVCEEEEKKEKKTERTKPVYRERELMRITCFRQRKREKKI